MILIGFTAGAGFLNWITLNEVNLTSKPKRIWTITGVYGTVDGVLNKGLPGNKFQIDFWIRRSVYAHLPNKDQLQVLSGGLTGFMGRVTGDMKVRFTGDKNLLWDPGCELEEGGWFYMGSFGGDVKTPYGWMLEKLREIDQTLSRNQNAMIRMRGIVDMMSKSKDKGLQTQAETLSIMIKDVIDATERQRFVEPQQNRFINERDR